MTDPREALAIDREQARQKILSMSAGKELDALVSEHVFKTGVYECSGVKRIVVNEPHALEAEIIPPYSTDPGAAWGVVEVIRAQSGFRIEDMPETWWLVTVGREQACAETMPLAVARAALLALAEARQP